MLWKRQIETRTEKAERVESGQNDFLKFKEKLTNFFKTYPGAIFDAEQYRHFAGAGQEKSPRVFELASGQQKRHFLSFWALLQERDIFSETTQNLAKIAGAIREHTAFKTIVTCTTSSRYLMEYLHSDLEISENHKVDIRYFGPFPYHVVEGSDLQDLRDHRVLILTDVINSVRSRHILHPWSGNWAARSRPSSQSPWSTRISA